MLFYYKNYIVYYNVYVIKFVCSLKSMCMPSFFLIGCCVSELHAQLCPYHNVWPGAVYCCFTRTIFFTSMFTVIIMVCSMKSMCIPSFILVGCCVRELQSHLCPDCNVWPGAVYCCFARTTLFTELLTCCFIMCYRSLSLHQVLLFYTF